MIFFRLIVFMFLAALVHCATETTPADSESESDSDSTSYTIGGSVTGLSGTVVLQNNEDDDLSLTEDGEFTFATSLSDSSEYSVTVLTQPSGQTCTPTNNTGTISGANVTTVTITCADEGTFTIGGTLSNLGASKSVILQNNSGDDLTVSSNGSFTFTTALDDGSTYEVTVSTQPARQTCTVSNGSGTLSGANITNVTVACVTSNPRIFKTSTQYTGDLKTNGNAATGVAGADSLCMSNSSYPGNGTYKALIVDGANRVACTTANCGGGTSEHVDWVLSANTTYMRSDDTTTIGTTTSAGIFSFNLTNAFSDTANGHWTGLNANWTTSGGDCGIEPWASSSSSFSGTIGSATSVDSDAISTSDDQCNFNDNLICVEQ